MKLSCDRIGCKAAYIVCIGQARLYFSYQTLIGFQLGDHPGMRTARSFSPTTARHVTELGISHFPTHDDADFRAAVEDILTTGAFV